ncbi:hypothetical protein ACWEFJ_23015 [Actinosynnema sp. NPDC004786]
MQLRRASPGALPAAAGVVAPAGPAAAAPARDTGQSTDIIFNGSNATPNPVTVANVTLDDVPCTS